MPASADERIAAGVLDAVAVGTAALIALIRAAADWPLGSIAASAVGLAGSEPQLALADEVQARSGQRRSPARACNYARTAVLLKLPRRWDESAR
jgi:hypothetical protein